MPSSNRRRWRSPSSDRGHHRSPSSDRRQKRSPFSDRRRKRSPSLDRVHRRSPSSDRRQKRSLSSDRRRERSPSSDKERQRNPSTEPLPAQAPFRGPPSLPDVSLASASPSLAPCMAKWRMVRGYFMVDARTYFDTFRHDTLEPLAKVLQVLPKDVTGDEKTEIIQSLLVIFSSMFLMC